MKIYFACSITGGREEQTIYEELVDFIQSLGHIVNNAIISKKDILINDRDICPEEIYSRDTTWIMDSDVIIAEVSTPSHGVGYEIAYGLSKGKHILCCYLGNKSVSKMILGNPDKNLVKVQYNDINEIKEEIKQYLQDICK